MRRAVFGLLIAVALPVRASTHVFREAGAPGRACEVHLVDPARREQESVVPCGEEIRLTSRREAWIETPNGITPFRAGIEATDEREQLLPVEEGGAVALRLPDGAAFVEMWHLEPHLWRGRRAPAFWRQTSKANDVVRMPAGRGIAIARDVHGEAIALSTLFRVTAKVQTEATFAKSAGSAKLWLLLQRPSADGEAHARMSLNAETRVPEVTLDTADYIVGLWSLLPAGRGTLAVQSDVWRVEETSVILREGRVTAVSAKLLPLPSLRVVVNAIPEEALGDQRLSLRIVREDGTVVRAVDMTERTETVRSLPAVPLGVTLSFDHWKFRRSIDLSRGLDDTVSFRLEPIVVTGQVRYGGNPAPANVGFTTDELIAVDSDESGQYRIVLWQARRFGMRVALRAHPEVPPFLDTIRVEASRTLDIDVPSARYAVRVVNAETSEAVAGAKVTFTNEWTEDPGGARRMMTHVIADGSGRAALPPLRAGTLDALVEADGYERGQLRQTVDMGNGPREWDVRLRPLASPQRLSIVLPNGSPAAAAELVAVSPADEVVYATTADSDGVARLPESLKNVVLVVRRPETGGSVKLWTGMEDAHTPWRLPPAAPALHVRSTDAAGQPSAGSMVYVWINGLRLGGVALSFLARNSAITTMDGQWTGHGLPAEDTQILIVPRGVPPVDSLAQRVAFPWPGIVVVRAQ